jgi:hypothetical protein
MLMQCNLEAMDVWDIVEQGGVGVKRTQDRLAMSALLHSVSKEMWTTLGAKKTVKEAWDAVKSMRQGADRVKESHAQKLLQEFENIRFKNGELIDEFGLRINSLAKNLRGLGEVVDETRVVKKILRVLPKQYNQIAVSIETLLNINNLTVEELVGRLRAAEDRLNADTIVEKTEKLFLSEDQWFAKYRHRLAPEGSTSGNRGDRQGGFTQAKPKNMSQGDKKEPIVKLTSEGTPRHKGRCRNCGIYGHWKQDYKRPRKERREEAHHVKADDEQPMLMLATVNTVRTVAPWLEAKPVGVHVPHDVVHLNEEKTFPVDRDDETWVLDTGASNHMTRCRAVLKSLDTSVGGTVRFGDGSLVEIKGMGSVLLQTRNKGHKVLTSVYFIPKLKSNIVSLGQFEEGGCKIVIESGFYNLYDVDRCLLARAPRVKNRLYLLKMQLATPVCLVAMKEDKAWLWHVSGTIIRGYPQHS